MLGSGASYDKTVSCDSAYGAAHVYDTVRGACLCGKRLGIKQRTRAATLAASNTGCESSEDGKHRWRFDLGMCEVCKEPVSLTVDDGPSMSYKEVQKVIRAGFSGQVGGWNSQRWPVGSSVATTEQTLAGVSVA